MTIPFLLPIDAVLPEILDAVSTHRRLVLVAAPGAGKTTRVPPALIRSGILTQSHPNLLLLQPRRVAARAVSARIAEENGWRVGAEVGYQIRFEKKVGPSTRLHVMTEGILNRRLVDDPFLAGVGAVVLDEFHERSIHSDLALAFLSEIRDSVRDDLIVIVMSATLAAEPVARFLSDSPIIRVEGRTFPVEVRYQASSGEPLPDRMARAIEDAVGTSLGEASDDVLAFLPGVEEIRRTARRLATSADRMDRLVLPLHGSLSATEQDEALRPSSRGRIILATNIAETSITINGVSTVIDGGLARVASFDPERGIDRLELVRISRASAAQRAGRAGRTRPGRCVRLWSEREERGMAATDVAEIHRIDLAATVLALRAWGITDPSRFRWFESPSPQRLDAAEATLRLLGAIDSNGRISEIGRRLLEIPAPPRLGRLLIEAERLGLAREGAALAAILSERDLLARGSESRHRHVLRPDTHETSDLFHRSARLEEAEHNRFHSRLREQGIDPNAARRVAQVRDDLLRSARLPSTKSKVIISEYQEDDLLKCLLVAYPDRVCRRRSADPDAALMVGGRGVRVEPGSVVRDGELFLAFDPREDQAGRSKEARVGLAGLVRAEWLTELFPDSITETRDVVFDMERERVVGQRVIRYRDLILHEDRHGPVDPQLASEQLVAAMLGKGLDWIREDDAAGAWLARFALLQDAMPEADLPSFDESVVQRIFREAAEGRRSVEEMRRVQWVELLRRRLSYGQARFLDAEAPEELLVPSGNRIGLRYELGKPPVLAVRLQELFGWIETPRIAGGRVGVTLHLLGPNFRPVQITGDLRSFWTSTYFQVRKDLRNRYPKHAWPEDPLTARAEARGGRRSK